MDKTVAPKFQRMRTCTRCWPPKVRNVIAGNGPADQFGRAPQVPIEPRNAQVLDVGSDHSTAGQGPSAPGDVASGLTEECSTPLRPSRYSNSGRLTNHPQGPVPNHPRARRNARADSTRVNPRSETPQPSNLTGTKSWRRIRERVPRSPLGLSYGTSYQFLGILPHRVDAGFHASGLGQVVAKT